MLVTRILAIVLDTTILIIAYKIMDKLEIKDYLKYMAVITLAIIMHQYFTIDYNWATLLVVLAIMYIEIRNDSSWKKEILIGLLAGITIPLKQTTGIVIVLVVLGWKVLTIRNKRDFKLYITNLAIRFAGVAIIVFTFLITLIICGALNNYVDYCILGIKTFSNKISYVNRLVKNSNILIRILSLLPLFIYITLGIVYRKTNKKEILVLISYSIAEMAVVYPISDEAHFVLAITPTVISIGYLLNLLTYKVKIEKKEEIFANIFIRTFIILFSIVYFIGTMNNYRLQNINFELEHFKCLPISKEGIEDIKQIDDFIEKQEKEVYILDATAAIYMIPANRYNKDYDMFNKGNLGSKGEEGQIEKIKNSENRLILIKNDKYSRNWQNPEEVRKYIIKNMKKIGEIGVFDIYE